MKPENDSVHSSSNDSASIKSFSQNVIDSGTTMSKTNGQENLTLANDGYEDEDGKSQRRDSWSAIANFHPG